MKKERPAKKNKKGKKGILVGGLVVVGVAAGAGGVFLYLNHKPAVELKSCYEITLTGNDKDATISVEIDGDKLEKKCQDLTLNEKKAKAAIRKKADESSSLESSDIDENYEEMFEYSGETPGEIIGYNLEAKKIQVIPKRKLRRIQGKTPKKTPKKKNLSKQRKRRKQKQVLHHSQLQHRLQVLHRSQLQLQFLSQQPHRFLPEQILHYGQISIKMEL